MNIELTFNFSIPEEGLSYELNTNKRLRIGHSALKKNDTKIISFTPLANENYFYLRIFNIKDKNQKSEILFMQLTDSMKNKTNNLINIERANLGTLIVKTDITLGAPAVSESDRSTLDSIGSRAHGAHDKMEGSVGDLSRKYIPKWREYPAFVWSLLVPKEPLPAEVLLDILAFQTNALGFPISNDELNKSITAQFESGADKLSDQFIRALDVIFSMLRLTANTFVYLSDKNFVEERYDDVELFKIVRNNVHAGDCEDLAFEIIMLVKSIKMMKSPSPLIQNIQRVLDLFHFAMTGGVAALPSLEHANGDQRIFHIYCLGIPRYFIQGKKTPEYPWEKDLTCASLEGTNFHNLFYFEYFEACSLTVKRWKNRVNEYYSKNRNPGGHIVSEKNGYFSKFYREVLFIWLPDTFNDGKVEYMVVNPSTEKYGVSFEETIAGNFKLVPTITMNPSETSLIKTLLAKEEPVTQYVKSECEGCNLPSVSETEQTLVPYYHREEVGTKIHLKLYTSEGTEYSLHVTYYFL